MPDDESSGLDTKRAEARWGISKFSRTLTINVPVDVNKVEATFDSGVLTITLPKAKAARPKTIKVEAEK